MNNLTHVLHDGYYYFIWQPFVERFALWYWTLSVYDVGVSWPDSSMDQDETWYGGRPRPRPHCVRWGPSFPSLTTHKRGHSSPQFSAHVCSGQTAGWIKMPLGTEVDLGPGQIVLDEAQLPSG